MIIAIIGEAGTGKDYFVNKLTKKYKKLFHKIVSYTTRPRRDNEIEGQDYYFTTTEHFQEMIDNKQILEYTCFNDWYYGTHIDEFAKNKINIGVFDPTGVRNLINAGYDVKVFKLSTSDKERILRQLNRENDPDINEIFRRYKADLVDFEKLDFEYLVLLNNDKQDLGKNLHRLYLIAKQYLGNSI